MADYEARLVADSHPARLVKVGVTPVVSVIDPETLDANDTFEMMFVPGGVRILGGFVTADGDLDSGAATLDLTVDLVHEDADGVEVVTPLLSDTTGVTTDGTSVQFDQNLGVRVVSEQDDAVIRVTVNTGAASLGDGDLVVGALWSSYGDEEE